MSEEYLGEWKKVYLEDLESVKNELLELISTPAVLLVEGEVGAGKTTFIKLFSEEGDLASPTYGLLNEAGTVLHADFYRIQEAEELATLELELYLENKKYCFFEWGINYLNPLKRIIGKGFNYYHLCLIQNPKKGDGPTSRNYSIKTL